MELREALSRIAEIRERLERADVFRGYRALPVAFSGVLAVAAGLLQPLLVPEPVEDLRGYLTLWLGVAALSAAATGLSILLRGASESPGARAVTRLAVGQFLPCLLSGACVTAVLVRFTPESVWLLPGVWQVLFGQGVFASCRLLPRGTFGVACFYLFAGCCCLGLARGEHALSPWAMALPFGVGQFATAALLYWALERRHDEAGSAEA